MSHGREDVAAGSADLNFREDTLRRLSAIEEEVQRLADYVIGHAEEREESSRRMMRALNGASLVGDE